MYKFTCKKIALPVLAFILFTIIFTNRAVAQQAAFTYTQYMDNLTPVNPAYSLLDKAGSISTLARKQWVGIDGAPTTYLINADVPFESIGSAGGFFLLN